jgi:hypothetical protein
MTFNEWIFTSQLGKAMTGIVIFALGLVIAYFTEKMVLFVLKELKINDAMKKMGFNIYLSETIADLVKKAIWVVFFMVALNQMDILKISIYIFTGIILLIFFLGAIIYAFDFFANLSKRKYVKASNKRLTETRILRHGDIMFVPHKYVYDRIKKK